jgi:hypothetical protein
MQSETDLSYLNKIIHNNEILMLIHNKQTIALLIVNNVNKLMHNELNLLIQKHSKPDYQSEQMVT